MPLVEAVVAGVLANAATSGVPRVHTVVQDRFRSRPSVTERFDDALAERIDERAEELDSRALTNVFHHWSAIKAGIDTDEVVFESEETALNWLVNEIAGHEEIAINDNERRELREVLADEYAEVVASFRKQVGDDEELHRLFQAEATHELLERLNAMEMAFERLAGSEPYELYDFPAERECVVNALIPGDSIPFADRSELSNTPEPGRRFVLGPSGSGKTRIIAEYVKRLPDDAVSQILVPDRRFLDQSDARALGRQSFDGDLLLVWEDLHKVEAGEETTVVERTLRELDNALAPDHELYTLLEARSGRLNEISMTLPDDFKNDKSVWAGYEPLIAGTVAESSLREMIDGHVANMDQEVDLTEAARDALVKQTRETKSAPKYIETVITTAEGRLTEEDIETLPEDVASVWRRKPYPKLRENAPEEWDVLVAMKVLYDLGVPAFSKLVHAVYLTYLDGDLSLFKTAVEGLEDRQWLTVVNDDDILGIETLYYIHDTQLEAIPVSGDSQPESLSELLQEEVDQAVPEPFRAHVHFLSGDAFYNWAEYSLAGEQWTAALDSDPEYAEVHYNYANLLADKLDRPEQAADHYEAAIGNDPEFAAAHNNYANLLADELNHPEQAADHYEAAINHDQELTEGHYNYAVLLTEDLDKPEKAAHHYRAAIRSDPEYAAAHNNYAILLVEELNEPEEATDYYKAAIDHNPQYAEAHYNYANLLKKELNEPKEAADHYEAAIHHGFEDPDVHNNYAVLLTEEMNEPEKAADHYEVAIDICPENTEARSNYSKLLAEELNKPEESANHLRIAIDVWFSSNTQRSLKRALRYIPAFANLCEKCNQSEVAVEYCDRALALLDEYSAPEIQQFESAIRLAYARLSDRETSERLPELYWYGLYMLQGGELDLSTDLLTEAWMLQTETGDETSYLAIAAGVWCVALPSTEVDAEEVERAINTVDTSQSPIVSALVTVFFTDEEPPVPIQIRKQHSLNDRQQHELEAWETLLKLN